MKIYISILFTERIRGSYEKQRYDGWYNNLAHPEWGSVGKIFLFNFLVWPYNNKVTQSLKEKKQNSYVNYMKILTVSHFRKLPCCEAV